MGMDSIRDSENSFVPALFGLSKETTEIREACGMQHVAHVLESLRKLVIGLEPHNND